jgi:hypothetical protein
MKRLPFSTVGFLVATCFSFAYFTPKLKSTGTPICAFGVYQKRQKNKMQWYPDPDMQESLRLLDPGFP